MNTEAMQKGSFSTNVQQEAWKNNVKFNNTGFAKPHSMSGLAFELGDYNNQDALPALESHEIDSHILNPAYKAALDQSVQYRAGLRRLDARGSSKKSKESENRRFYGQDKPNAKDFSGPNLGGSLMISRVKTPDTYKGTLDRVRGAAGIVQKEVEPIHNIGYKKLEKKELKIQEPQAPKTHPKVENSEKYSMSSYYIRVQRLAEGEG